MIAAAVKPLSQSSKELTRISREFDEINTEVDVSLAMLESMVRREPPADDPEVSPEDNYWLASGAYKGRMLLAEGNDRADAIFGWRVLAAQSGE